MRQRIAIGTCAVVALWLAAPVVARAGFEELADGVRQWDWATTQENIVGMAVRSDGVLLLSLADGWLYRVPVGREIAVGPSDRIGRGPLQLRDLVLRGDELFAMDADQQWLHRIDASTGRVRERYRLSITAAGYWFNASARAMTLDPRTGRILWPEEAPGNRVRIRAFDPADERVRTWLTIPGGDYEVVSLRFTPDADELFVGHHGEPTTGTLTAFDRTGQRRWRGEVHGKWADDIAFSDEPCFRGQVNFTGADASVCAIGLDDPDRQPFYVAKPEPCDGLLITICEYASVPMTTDPDGNLVTSTLRTVVVLACIVERRPPPTPHPDPDPGRPPPPADAQGTDGGGLFAAPPGGGGGAPALQTSPAHAGQPQAGFEAGGQGAAQSSVGLADAPDDQPAMSLSATLLRPVPARAALAAGALFVLFLAGAAMHLTRDEPDPSTATGGRR